MAETRCVVYDRGYVDECEVCDDYDDISVYDDAYYVNDTVGCVTLIGTKGNSTYVGGRETSVWMIGFFYVVLLCIFAGLVWGVRVGIKRKCRQQHVHLDNAAYSEEIESEEDDEEDHSGYVETMHVQDEAV